MPPQGGRTESRLPNAWSADRRLRRSVAIKGGRRLNLIGRMVLTILASYILTEGNIVT